MNSNTVVYSSKRSVPGREHLSAAHFEEFTGYLAGLQRDGTIQSFEPVLLDPNAGGVGGFILMRLADEAGLGRLMGRSDFTDHVIRSMLHLEEPTLSCGVTGPAVKERMARWVANFPK